MRESSRQVLWAFGFAGLGVCGAGIYGEPRRADARIRAAEPEPEPRRGVAWLACEPHEELEGGDQVILLGRPLDAGSDPDREPLVVYDGRFHVPAFARAAAVDTGAAGE